MPPFKIIIVGGSIAGLTLANILERYGIDYIVLEKHTTIAPQLGASLCMLPHGARILDQLGIWSKIEKMSMSIGQSQSFGPDGLPLGAPEPFGDTMAEVMHFLDRQQLLEVLFQNLQDKSKVFPACDVFKIEELDGGVQVALKDGSIITGDILVGADGVHSRMRDEIWRIAESESSEYGAAKMSQSIKCDYKCIFGIGKRPEGITDYASFKCFHKGRSYLISAGPDNKLYFFAFFKNSATTTHRAIPRYTSEDANALAAKFASDPLFNGITFGQIYQRIANAVLVPLEEYVLKKCFYKRAILIGDSFHKMNPLAGQGGNSAIESAGVLADLFKETLDQEKQPSNETIEHIFHEFQEIRRPRATGLMEMTKKMQKMEVLDNTLIEFLQLKITSKMGVDHIVPMIASGSTPGRTLKYLPKNIKNGAVALDEEVRVNPRDRSTLATVAWSVLMLFIASLSWSWTQLLGSSIATNFDKSGFGPLYVLPLAVAINTLWVIESYRPGLFLSPLVSAVPFNLAVTKLNWATIAPLYFALYIITSRGKSFYFPFPRAIDHLVAKSLLASLFIAYIPAALRVLPSLTQGERPDLSSNRILLASHLALPVLLHLGKRILGASSVKLSVGQRLFSSHDLKYLTRFYTLLFFLMSTAHLVLVSLAVPQVISDISALQIIGSWELTQFACLALAIVAWCLFAVWEMRRVDLTEVSLLTTFVVSTLSSILIGPAAVLFALWGWREHVLEIGRQRI
ncbi:hypothetical protein N7532_001678 [Penicillium argentinense]|uniref:FAD-binding domain-containing protein n=1 Tax=Penicillium argentinense TaxID=1131581 RepID=A0A9W9G330_9EURO|nr:uncharacterized protein N7532_001678 [Penicillium argentinense]KAJ5111143.1 hypothetical protein N7532_001678 [Penicillium argentinense]